MATTPPLRASVQPPPTPLHGAKYDNYRPSTRKSTRHTIPRSLRALETPPPNSEDDSHSPALRNSTKLSNLRSAAHNHSPPSSTQTSPKKVSRKQKMSNRSTDAKALDGRSSSTEVSSVALIQGQDKHPSSQHPSMAAAAGMLPTPAKTPRKKPVQPGAVNAAARVLFPVHAAEDVMPTPRKRKTKRHVGFSLYDSMENVDDADSEEKIQIYTDSKDKIPELDPTEDNPFYEPPEQYAPPPGPSKGRSRKRKVAPAAEDRQEVKDAFNREDGMVYVFRGKKIFREFPKDDDNSDAANDSDLERSNIRPLTRSSIKPRLLFPTQKQQQERETADLDDEEATTDIEDPEDHVTTPVKQTVFSPATPPTTGHATRSSTKRAPEPVDTIPYKGKKVSPFDGWARTKAGSGTATGAGGNGKKREAEPVEKTEFARSSKKVKCNGVT